MKKPAAANDEFFINTLREGSAPFCLFIIIFF
jgi:hypothetical protein